jgi:hypothetical protein
MEHDGHYSCRGREKEVGVEIIGCGSRRRGKSGTASEARRLARGGYVPQSRDIRGIGMSFKITPEMSSPMNTGPSGIGDPTVSKTVGSAYVGSNPTPATRVFPDIVGNPLTLSAGT